MFKSAIALAAAAPLMAAPALAGPYVNVETNAGWAGDDYVGATTDIHVGYGGALGEDASWYIQGALPSLRSMVKRMRPVTLARLVLLLI